MAMIDLARLYALTDALVEKEKALKKYEEMMRTMCDLLPDMIWAKDLNERYLFANKAVCEKLLNTNSDFIIGQTDMDVARRERKGHENNGHPWHGFGEACHESDQIVLTTGKPYRRIEEDYVKGKLLTIDVRKFPLRDGTDKIVGVVGCARDVTGRHRRWNDYHPVETEKMPDWRKAPCRKEEEEEEDEN